MDLAKQFLNLDPSNAAGCPFKIPQIGKNSIDKLTELCRI
jgi:hypothetical protein